MLRDGRLALALRYVHGIVTLPSTSALRYVHVTVTLRYVYACVALRACYRYVALRACYRYVASLVRLPLRVRYVTCAFPLLDVHVIATLRLRLRCVTCMLS